LPYDTDDSEAEEMKTSIRKYKKSVNNAKGALEADAVVVNHPAALDLPSTLGFPCQLLQLTHQQEVWFSIHGHIRWCG
jgi:hypothetical protein